MRCKNKKETLKLFSKNWLDSFVYDWLSVYSQSDRHGQKKESRNSINVNDLFSGTKEKKK